MMPLDDLRSVAKHRKTNAQANDISYLKLIKYIIY